MGHSLLSRNCIAAGSLAMLLLAPMRVDAQQQFPPQQMALLPPYCPYTFIFRDSVPGGNDQAQKERWMSAIGGMFSHMHHYCFGLMNRNDAKLKNWASAWTACELRSPSLTMLFGSQHPISYCCRKS
jgi:hypothetical protein